MELWRGWEKHGFRRKNQNSGPRTPKSSRIRQNAVPGPGINSLYAGKFQVLEPWRGWEKHGFRRNTSLYAGKFQVLELWRGWEKHGFRRKIQNSRPRTPKSSRTRENAVPGPGINSLYAGKFQVLELWRGWEKHGFSRKNHDSGPRISKKFQDLVVLIQSAANISLLSAAFRNLG